MNTLWNRLNAVFFFSISTLVALGAMSSVTSFWLPSTPAVRVLKVTRLQQLKEFRPMARADTQDRATLRFDLDADLTGIFNWNVKQLFAYVSATYETPTNNFSEVVIWDTIIVNASAARLYGPQFKDMLNKYPLVDQKTELRGAAVALTLNWDVMPITGLLKHGSSGTISRFKLPASYCQDLACSFSELPVVDEAAGKRAAADAKAGGRTGEEKSAANWASELNIDDL